MRIRFYSRTFKCFTCTLVIGQIDHILFVLWYISIYNNLERKQVKDVADVV